MGSLRRVLYEVDGANRVLPLVRAIVEDVVTEFRRLRSAGGEQRRLERAGGHGTAAPDLDRIKARVDDASARVEGYLRELEDLGVEVRDLETGLVDFPTLMRGEPAYLCWKPGEPEVLWWHAAGDGFAERQPLPQPVVARVG